MTDPVLHLMEKALIKKGKQHLTGYVPNYFCMRLALGMVNPSRIDDIWDPDAAAYNPRLSRCCRAASSGNYILTRDPAWSN